MSLELPPSHPLKTAHAFTREALVDGSMLAAIRASAPAGTYVRSDAELDASLDASLKDWCGTEDVWVFGYGSLMWNPAFHFTESAKGRVHGWSRKFCLWLYMARGTPDRPGLMLALDRGGACHGMVFRIAAAEVRHELGLLWRREMLTGAYEARWVTAQVERQPLRALTFVANRHHARYAGTLSGEETARFIATGQGRLGTCSAYFEATIAALEGLQIRDAGIERLRRAFEAQALLLPTVPAEAAAELPV
jgi:cation transport protein ChaC